MPEVIKIKVDFDGDTAKALLNFISDTEDGKFTNIKPDLAQIAYNRLEIQEQENSDIVDGDEHDEVLLFGVSY